MSTHKGKIIPLLSKRYLRKAGTASTSRVMRHVAKETAKMAVDKEKPSVRVLEPKVRDEKDVH